MTTEEKIEKVSQSSYVQLGLVVASLAIVFAAGAWATNQSRDIIEVKTLLIDMSAEFKLMHRELEKKRNKGLNDWTRVQMDSYIRDFGDKNELQPVDVWDMKYDPKEY